MTRYAIPSLAKLFLASVLFALALLMAPTDQDRVLSGIACILFTLAGTFVLIASLLDLEDSQ